MSNHLRVTCPHCGHIILLGLDAQAVQTKRRGPAPHDPGPEVDTYVIEKIEKGLSLRAVAELLEERGVEQANGGRRWSASGIRRLYEHALIRRAERINQDEGK